METAIFFTGGAFLGFAFVWLAYRWTHLLPIIPRIPRKPAKDAYLESIRWTGQIYCEHCGSTLKRIHLTKDPDELPKFDPFTKAKIDPSKFLGDTGLMVCSRDSAEMRSALMTPFAYYGLSDSDFRERFQDRKPTRHGMYYVDTPPLVKA